MSSIHEVDYYKEGLRQMGSCIKTAREARGYCQYAVARSIGYEDRSSIAHLESGKKMIPRSKFKELCDFLELDYFELMHFYLMCEVGKLFNKLKEGDL